MKIIRHCMALFVAGLICGIAFASSKELAKVDGFGITDVDFKDRVGLLSPVAHERVMANKGKFLDKLIDEELLVREAKKMNLNENKDFKLKIETTRRELLADLYLKEFLKESNTESGQRKFYEENKEKYIRPEMVRISVIRLTSEDEAKNVLKEAEGGKDFAELAGKYSKGPAASKGGDFGFRSRETIREEFADDAFSMKKDEIRGPIKAEDGYYIIKVTDRREKGPAPFEELKSKITNDYAMKLLSEKISELRKAVKIQVDSAELEKLILD